MSKDPAQRLTAQLRRDLARGEYHPRERLVESELIARYGYPRATVRSALLSLQAEGLVERPPNRGASVRALSVAEGIEIAEVRRELEALCAREAATLATPEERDTLRSAMSAMRLAAETNDVYTYRQSSTGFHELIIAFSRHTGAGAQLASLRLHNLQRHFPNAFLTAPFSDSLNDHLAIGEAVVGGDPEAAEANMRRHLDRVIELLEPHLDATR